MRPSTPVPDLGERLASFDLDHALPSWLAALDLIVSAWIAAGELDGTQDAPDRMRASLDAAPSPTRLATGTEALLRGRLHAARAESSAVAEAIRAVDCARAAEAPWWLAKSVRLLESLQAAPQRSLDEARQIEEALGLLGPAV